jgi:hypothetical protein
MEMFSVASFRRVFSLALTVAVAGCGGGSGAQAVSPNAPVDAASARHTTAERMLGTLHVDPRNSDAAAAHVAYAAAPRYYYGPNRHRANAAAPAANRKNLTYEGGPVVERETAIDIYVNCPDGSCWGDPGDLSVRLGESSYIHVADQYMKPKVVTDDGRYTYTGGLSVEFPKKTMMQKDLFAMLHSSAREMGGGLGKLYHVFLKSDSKLCEKGPECTIDYCAFHSTVVFNDVGPVNYSVEPYQKGSCLMPNGKFRDSTDSTLLHEIFEAVTDPMVNLGKLGWYNSNTIPGTEEDYGEVADYCDAPGGVGYPDLGDYREQVQKIWSNARERCTFLP